ncbi:cbb3-type cytochrome oxidase assembly protein CcoS [Flavicella marina]|uniref:cbb3-type cytochrome oxidase assembly protein CcoS n=1 Tax=Flavicella marina TaxID=1475951 RepID=UPI0012642AB9|nr:cbb3-type cytochrome oxidase assembly protein CcoS [Flavicella marina]
MSIIYLLITISLIVALIFFTAFIKAVKSGQYDDSYTPSVRILFDDKPVQKSSQKNSNTKKQLTNS